MSANPPSPQILLGADTVPNSVATHPKESVQHAARSLSIDIAKGLGILLVVFGHNWIVQHENGEMYRIIFSVHMPLFFFLSGIFLSADKRFLTLVRQRSDSLLKPYFIVLVGLALFNAIAAHGIGGDYFFGMLYAAGQSLLWIPLWFLPNLFVAQLIAVAVIKLDYFRASRLRLLPLLVLMLPLGVVLLRAGDEYVPMTLELLPGYFRTVVGLPWSLDLVILNTTFLLAGYVAADWIKALDRHALTVTLLAGVLFAGLHILFNDTLDLNERRYDSVLISSLAAFSGIALLLGLSALLGRLSKLARPLAYLGTASLFIFIFHAVVQGRFSGFFQRHLPDLPYAAASLGFVAGVVGPLLLFALCQRSRLLSALLLPKRS